MTTRTWAGAFLAGVLTLSNALAQGGHGAMTPTAPAGGAILFDNLGRSHRPVTTTNPAARQFFDQGLRLLWAFNLDEAQRSFEEAARLDPGCAMAHWGIAMSLAPNINVPAMPDRALAGYAAARKAGELAASASPVEQALIRAVSRRFAQSPPDTTEGQAALDRAYAEEMRTAMEQFPDDPDVRALFAESLMTLRPWDLWKPDGTPQPGTGEIVAILESILATHPDHPGANHYYIHAVEASPNPEKALGAAERLPGLMPGAAHLVHMPSHIYMRLGRYEDACEANRRAIEVDKTYLAAVGGPPGFYAMYAAHNYHFLSAAAAMQGRSAEAIRTAREMLAALPPGMFASMPEMDGLLAQPVLMLARFGRWDEVLAEPPVPPGMPFPAALRSYARGLALLSKGDIELAEGELAQVVAALNATPAESKKFLNSGRTLLTIARHLLQGRIAASKSRWAVAEQNFRTAIELEDGLRYDEPSNWYAPVRQALGAMLMESGDHARAAEVYREDLKRNPANGWSLYGIGRSFRARELDDEARPFEAEFKEAWKNADVKLRSSWY